MIQSQQVLEWQEQARIETLLDVLGARFGALPVELPERMRAVRDEGRWGRLVVSPHFSPALLRDGP